MNQNDSQLFESYIPLYDVMPPKWEDARETIVEQFKKISEGINVREIGWYLDEELLSGKSFIPGVNIANDGGDSEQYRSILRKVIITGALTSGTNTIPHGINVDANFTLIQLWASATNASTFRSVTFGNYSTVYMDATNVYIVSDGTYTRSYAIIEYLQEL